MKAYGWKVGKTIILRGTVNPVDLQLTIVGVLNEEASGPRIIFRRDYLEELLGSPGIVNVIWVKLDHSQSAPEAIAAIDEMFANSAHETATETEVVLIKNELGRALSLMLKGAKVLAAIVTFTIALVTLARRSDHRLLGVPNRHAEESVGDVLRFLFGEVSA